MGKSTISMSIFNSFLYVYQRVIGVSTTRKKRRLCRAGASWNPKTTHLQDFLKGTLAAMTGHFDNHPRIGNLGLE